MKKMAGHVGFQLTKKKGGAHSKVGAKAKSGSAKAGSTKNKKNQSAVMEMSSALINTQFCVAEKMSQPAFRYIPDRDTIHRLLIRCSNMKDDLAEFDLFEEKHEEEGEEKAAEENPNENQSNV